MSLSSVEFEIVRKCYLYHKDSLMPGGGTLGFTGDPNTATSTGIENVLYYAPGGTSYCDKGTVPYTFWDKAGDGAGGIWVLRGSGVGGGGVGTVSDKISGTEGFNLTVGSLCYLDSTTGLWELADYTSTVTAVGLLGFKVAGGLFQISGSIQIGGLVKGATYYIGVAGTISATPPITNGYVNRIVGFANSGTEFIVSIEQDYYVVGEGEGSTIVGTTLESTAIAGEDISKGDCVVVGLDGRGYKAVCTDELRISGLLGISKTDSLSDSTVTIQYGGPYPKVTLSATKYYVSDVPGQITNLETQISGTFSRVLGYGNGDTFNISPDENYYEIGDLSGGSTGSYSNIVTGTEGTLLSDGDLCYLHSDGKWYKATNVNEDACSGLLGIRVDANTFQISGTFQTSNLTSGSVYYVGTNGYITDNVPEVEGSISRVIGYASSSTELVIDIDQTYFVVAGIDLGTSDTPSTTHSFLDFIDNAVIPHSTIIDATNIQDLSAYFAQAINESHGTLELPPNGNILIKSGISISGSDLIVECNNCVLDLQPNTIDFPYLDQVIMLSLSPQPSVLINFNNSSRVIFNNLVINLNADKLCSKYTRAPFFHAFKNYICNNVVFNNLTLRNVGSVKHAHLLINSWNCAVNGVQIEGITDYYQSISEVTYSGAGNASSRVDALTIKGRQDPRQVLSCFYAHVWYRVQITSSTRFKVIRLQAKGMRYINGSVTVAFYDTFNEVIADNVLISSYVNSPFIFDERLSTGVAENEWMKSWTVFSIVTAGLPEIQFNSASGHTTGDYWDFMWFDSRVMPLYCAGTAGPISYTNIKSIPSTMYNNDTVMHTALWLSGASHVSIDGAYLIGGAIGGYGAKWCSIDNCHVFNTSEYTIEFLGSFSSVTRSSFNNGGLGGMLLNIDSNFSEESDTYTVDKCIFKDSFKLASYVLDTVRDSMSIVGSITVGGDLSNVGAISVDNCSFIEDENSLVPVAIGGSDSLTGTTLLHIGSNTTTSNLQLVNDKIKPTVYIDYPKIPQVSGTLKSTDTITVTRNGSWSNNVLTGGTSERASISQIRGAMFDTKFVNAKEYGLGDNPNTDTASMIAAINAANALNAQYVDATLYVPPGSYSIAHGQLPVIQTNFLAGNCIFTSYGVAADYSPMFTVAAARRLEIVIGHLNGYRTNTTQTWYEGTPHGIGIWFPGMVNGSSLDVGHRLDIEKISGFQRGISLDGTVGNKYPGHVRMVVKEIMLCDEGVYLASGGIGGSEYNEANRLTVHYSVANKIHIHFKNSLDNIATMMQSNVFEIFAELHATFSQDEVLIKLDGRQIENNFFTIGGTWDLQSPVNSKVIWTVNGARNNVFSVKALNLSQILCDSPNIINNRDDAGLGSYATTYGRSELYHTAAPTTSYWRAGDKVWNCNPTAGGFLGWVCTTSGTPGTWKTFGAISA